MTPEPSAPDGAVDLSTLDLCDLDLFRHGFPHDVFAQLRRHEPVWWQAPTDRTPGGDGFWVVSRHADVRAVAGDAATFSSECAPGAPGGGTLIEDLPVGLAAGVLLNMTDGDRHRELRRLVTPSVSPRALAMMEGELRRRARRLVDDVTDRGRCDFLTEVAVELPLQAVAALMGIPDEDRHDLLRWSNATLDFDGRELGEPSARAAEAGAAMAAYGTEHLSRLRERPGDDVLSSLLRGRVTADDGGTRPVGELELLMFFNLLVVAGSETTRNSIALGLVALIEHPDQLEAVRADRSLLPGAVEEVLRWTSATTYNRRTAVRPCRIGERDVAAGEKVTVWWPSANRDEEAFESADRFDVRRDPNPHLTFGLGSHFCLGAALARREVAVVLDAVLDRWTDLSLTGPVERVRTNKHAGVRSVPIAFRAR